MMIASLAFALCYEFKSRFDMSLLHLMVDQISSILYQAEVVKDIVDVKQYYQTIIDHISAVIIVVDYEFNILFKNKKYDEYFNFECKTLDQLIQRYPSLDVIKSMDCWILN